MGLHLFSCQGCTRVSGKPIFGKICYALLCKELSTPGHGLLLNGIRESWGMAACLRPTSSRGKSQALYVYNSVQGLELCFFIAALPTCLPTPPAPQSNLPRWIQVSHKTRGHAPCCGSPTSVQCCDKPVHTAIYRAEQVHIGVFSHLPWEVFLHQYKSSDFSLGTNYPYLLL